MMSDRLCAPSSVQNLNQGIDFYEIQQGGYAIENNINAIILIS
jgi:hypothetical protein